MDSEDELSLLSPDWDEDFCDSGVHVGILQEATPHDENEPNDVTPVVRLTRVAFADVENSKRSQSHRPGNPAAVPALIKSKAKPPGHLEGGARTAVKSSLSRKASEQLTGEIPSCLKKNSSHYAAHRIVTGLTPTPPYLHVPHTAAPFQTIGGTTRSTEMSFGTPSVISDDATSCQNIELNTIKFRDSAVDKTFSQGYLPSQHLSSSNSVPDLTTSSPRTAQRILTEGSETAFIHPGGSRTHTSKSNHMKSGDEVIRSAGFAPSHVNQNAPSDVQSAKNPNDVYAPNRQTSQRTTTEHKSTYKVVPQNTPLQNHAQRPSTNQTRRDSDVPNDAPRPPAYQRPFPQTCCAAGLHPGFNSDRRLPDYVTIDQCYSGVDDSECRTICIVANFDGGGTMDKEHGDHRSTGGHQHGPGQGHVPRRGGPNEGTPRKERTSLRRGVMMRQMSMNPSHEQEMHLLSEMRFGDGSNQCPEQYQPMAGQDPWENYQSDNNRRLSNCSFSRAPPPGGGPPPPLVVVEGVEEFSRKDSGGSLAGNVSGDDSERWRPSARDQHPLHGSPSTGKIKMKDIGLSHAASAQRFRLTFDETADAAANNNIELPFDVAPQALSTKRPSCICGEPELPPGDCFSHLLDAHDSTYSANTKLDGPYDGPHTNSYDTRDTLLRNTYSSNVDALTSSFPTSPAAYPTVTPFCHSPIPHHDPSNPDVSFLTSPESQCKFGDIISTCDCDTENTRPSRVLTQMDDGQSLLDSGHPKVTICISNSQQSFIPYTCDSPTFDHQGDEHYQLNDFLSHHNNNNRYMKDAGGGYIDTMSPVDYTSFTQQPYNHVDCSCGLSNGNIPSEELRLLSHQDGTPMLQHQDTVSAPPIQDLYRYHVFFSHCPEDREWVEHMVAHLEAPPFNYTCAYASLQDEADPGTLQQRILCAAMLSERVVLVLSRRYVEDTWFSFEKTLKQLTQMSLHNQRIMGVLLEDCEIPDSLGELYFLDSSDPDFFLVFTKRLKTSRIPRSSASVSSDLGQTTVTPANVTNGKILTFCRLHVKVGWDSFLCPADGPDLDIPPSLSAHGIGMEKTEFGEIVTKVSGIVHGSNKLPWLLSAQPLAALLLAGALWLPAFIAVLVVHVDDDSGIALPVRLAVFLFPLGLVAAGYLIKWRRGYWLTKIVRLLVQNCIDVNQALYFQGRPLFVTAAHVRANIFAIYFVYFDATDCVRSVDLLLFTCMEDDWEKLIKLITFYTRDENYLSRMSISERLTVMMSAPYLVKLVRQVLPHPPQQRHVSRLLCLCQFTEECISRFAHGLDREDVPGLAELFTRHMPGKVSGSAVRRVQEELFHANHGLVP